MVNDNDALESQLACFLLAGGEGRRLLPLTKFRAKPSLPFGGNASLIDLTLLNCHRSGIRDVHILVQYCGESIMQGVKHNWRAVEQSRDMAISFRSGSSSPGGYRGTAHAVRHNLERMPLRRIRDVLILSGDHVYDMDYRIFLAWHRVCGADLTVAATDVPIADASRFGILRFDGDCRVTAFWEKPSAPEKLQWAANARLYASMGVYLFRAEALRAALAAQPSLRHDADFGRDVLPAMLSNARVFAFPFLDPSGHVGYWRDVGTLESYYRTQIETAGRRRQFQIRIPPDFPPSPLRRSFWDPLTGTVCGSDCRIEGDAIDSVIGAGACIARRARVQDAVLLENVVIEEGACVRRALIDRGARVPAGTIIDGETRAGAIPHAIRTLPGDVTVVSTDGGSQRIPLHRRPVTA
ncbi:MAG TPA: hypothetical protein DCM87_07965 [Planctomycetes bacterium]|nr:hypothetical protein [Planctomycetota bacterium]